MKYQNEFFSTHRKYFTMAFVLITSFCIVATLFLPVQSQAKNIKVGVIDCYSGPPAVFGKDALNGFKLALEEINAKGVLGGKIEYTTRDTKFKVDIALNMAKELVMREDVDVLVGTINSGAAMAVSEAVAKTEKVPFIIWISKSERLTGEKGHRYVFSAGEIQPWPARPAVSPCPRSLMSNTGLPAMTMNMVTPSAKPPGRIFRKTNRMCKKSVNPGGSPANRI